MVNEISETTLKRLGNYEAVIQHANQEAEQLQWRVMTLEVMQAAEKSRVRTRQVNGIVAYARYLHRLQTGQGQVRNIYGEPLLSQSLDVLLEELSIQRRMVP